MDASTADSYLDPALEGTRSTARTLLAALNMANQDMAECIHKCNALRAELAALKARRCETCVHRSTEYPTWADPKVNGYGFCQRECPTEYIELGPHITHHPTTHFCSYWEARDG